MNKHLIAAFLIAASAAATGTAFTSSGYGPAPHYDQGDADHGTRAFGGMSDMASQSGIRLALRNLLPTYSHH